MQSLTIRLPKVLLSRSIDCTIVSPDGGAYFLAICLQGDVCKSKSSKLGPVAQDHAFPNNVMRLEAPSRILSPQGVLPGRCVIPEQLSKTSPHSSATFLQFISTCYPWNENMIQRLECMYAATRIDCP